MEIPEDVPRGTLKWWQRFQFIPFWHLTYFGFLWVYFGRINIGGDEVRGSRFVIVPLVGNFIWFDKEECSDPDCFHNGGES